MTNSAQTVTGSINYDAFGQTVGSTGSSSDPYMFAATSGYRNDGDAGMMLVGARYFDAQVGRFITRDTLLDQPPYAYCEHDPANRVDPSGHIDWIEVLHQVWVGLNTGAGGLAGGAIAGGGGVVLGGAGGAGWGEITWQVGLKVLPAIVPVLKGLTPWEGPGLPLPPIIFPAKYPFLQPPPPWDEA